MNTHEHDNDPIVSEVRRFREEYLASFGYDMNLVAEDIKRHALKWPGKRVSYDKKDPERNL
jgi:hypothetical protein